MPTKKSNVEYLRDLINDHVGEKNKDEALEFLEAIENEISDLKEEVDNLQNGSDPEAEEPEYDNEINTRLGPNDNIQWSAGNVNANSMMTELGEAVERGIPLLKIENLLRAL